MAKTFLIFGIILIWITVALAYEPLFKKPGCYAYNSAATLESRRTRRNFSNSTTIQICTNNKPLKPKRILEQEKKLCGQIGYNVCRSTDKIFNTLIWKETKSAVPKGCFGFLFGDNLKKAGGYGKSCSRNHYLDGVLCCPKPSSIADTKKVHSSGNGRFRRIKKSHLVTNLVKK